MTIEFSRNDGTESLNEREPFLRLVDEGSVSNFDTLSSDSDGTVYEYKITVPRPVDDKAFLLFVKSDYDKMTRFRPSDFSSDSMTFYFISTINTNKQYKYFAPYDFDTFTTSTDYGMQVFGSSGNILYDSRVKEAILKDSFTVNGPFESISHAQSPEAWYSISSFPRGVSYKGINTRTIKYRLWSFEQINQSQVDISEMTFLGGSANPPTTEQKFLLPPTNMIILDE